MVIRMIDIDLQKGEIIITSPYEEKDRIKSLSQRKWNPDIKRWIAPVSILDEILTKFPDAEISTSILEEIEKVKKLKTASNAVSSSVDLNINGNKLMPFQNAGVEFLEIAGGKALIADEMGLGKTIEAIAYLFRHPELRPAIIICPASLKINWQREIKKWMNEDAIIVNGKQIENGHKIYIINYDILKNHKDAILNIAPQIMILDESHYVKNYKAQRTKLIVELSQKIPKKILLTGTPILNRPKELWTQLNVIDPKTYNNFFNFGVRYCAGEKTKYGWDFSGVSHQDELNEKLKTIMVRRTKAQVLSELPDKRRTTIDIPINNQDEYNEAKNNFYRFILDWKGKDAANKASRAEVLSQIETLKQVAIKGKMDEIIEWINDFLETGEKLIIFAHHRDIVEQIYKQYYNIAVKLTGETNMEDRQKAVDAFQNNPDIKLFIGNIKAAGVGITLTAASNVAFIELPWTPSELTQAEDRAHRIGQKNAVNIYYLVAEGTIESRMAGLLKKKAEIIGSIIDGKEVKDFDIFNELLEEI